jgi:hypothetical protein
VPRTHLRSRMQASPAAMVLPTSQPSSYPVLSTGPAGGVSQPPPGGGAATRGHAPSPSPPRRASHHGPAPIGTPQNASPHCRPRQAPELVHLVTRDNPARAVTAASAVPGSSDPARAIGIFPVTPATLLAWLAPQTGREQVRHEQAAQTWPPADGPGHRTPCRSPGKGESAVGIPPLTCRSPAESYFRAGQVPPHDRDVLVS